MKIQIKDDGTLLVDGENNTVITRSDIYANALSIVGWKGKLEIRNFVIILDPEKEKKPTTIIVSELDPFGEEDWAN